MAKNIININSTVTGTSGTLYTCPAGKVAEVVVAYASIRTYGSGSYGYLYIGNARIATNGSTNSYFYSYLDPMSEVVNVGSAELAYKRNTNGTVTETTTTNSFHLTPGQTIRIQTDTSSGQGVISGIIVEEDIGVQ